MDYSQYFQERLASKKPAPRRRKSAHRPDPEKRKGFKLDCGHYEAGGIELQEGRRVLYECPRGCGMMCRMSAAKLRAAVKRLPEEPPF